MKRQLAAAEARAAATQKKIDELNAKGTELDETIEQNLALVNDLTSRIEKCKAEYRAIEKRIENIELTIIPQLQSEKAAIEAEISKISVQISNLKT